MCGGGYVSGCESVCVRKIYIQREKEREREREK